MPTPEQHRIVELAWPAFLGSLFALDECRVLYENFDDLPEECQHILANMMFNMGRPRLSKFVGMKSGIYARDWNRAADEMVDSRWYDQVTNRAKRLVARMRALAEAE